MSGSSLTTKDGTGRSARVLQLLLHEVRGGAEEHVLSVLSAARNYGLTPLVGAPASLLQLLKPDLAKLQVKGLPVEVPTLISWPYRTAQLAALLTRERIDLIHCHSVTASLCAGPAARLSRKQPIIETCHGREFWRDDKRIKGNFWLDRQTSRLVSKYIAVSHATGRYLWETKGISQDKIVVIHNGRDLTALTPATPAERAEARAALRLGTEHALLLLGRLAVEKGHALLLDALKLLCPEQIPLIALFAGIGPLDGELRSRCEASGLSSRVRFLGYRGDLKKLLAAADLVVLPSISEGLPLVAIEALAAGRPVVATDVGGTSEVVVDGETGLLIRPGNAVALAQGIRRLLDDPGLALRLSTNGRRFVEKHFDIHTQTQRTMALYHDLRRHDATMMPRQDASNCGEL